VKRFPPTVGVEDVMAAGVGHLDPLSGEASNLGFDGDKLSPSVTQCHR
jgi:hypothetical protein